MGIIWTIALGFFIGLIAKLVHPGKENMGFILFRTIIRVAASHPSIDIGDAL